MASVTFPTGLGGDGSTVTDDDNPTTGLREGGWRTRFVPCLSNTVAIADQITSRTIFGSDTSATSTLVVAGTKTFTTAGLLVWAPGMFVTIARTSAAVATNMYGQVTAYNPTTKQLTVNVTSIVGSGTYTDWTISIAPPGLAAFSFTGATTIAVSSASDALRVTQSGAGNALVVEDSANPDSSPFVITADGTMVLGYTTSINSLGYAQGAQFYRQSGTIGQFRYSTDTGASELVSSKSRGTQASPTIVVNGDGLWLGRFAGYDGANFIEAARFSVEVDGTPGTNDMPGRLIFSTTADGASSPTERMRIRSDGNIGIGFGGSGSANIYLAKSITGATTAYGFLFTGQIQTDVTAGANYIFTQANVASGFASALPNIRHFYATQGTLSSAVTSQFGFDVDSSLISALNNYGFRSNIPYSIYTSNYNFYASGSAPNYFAGAIGIGTTPTPGTHGLFAVLNLSSATSQNITSQPTFQNTVTDGRCFTSFPTVPTGTALTNLYHYRANQQTLVGTVANVYGFNVEATVIGGSTATYGFHANIPAAANRFNFYAASTAINYFAGPTGVGVTPSGLQFQVQAASNTTVAAFGNAGGTSAFVMLRNSVATANEIRFGAESGDLTFYTATVERLRISSAGAATFTGAIKGNTTIAGGYTAHAAGTTAMALGSNNVVKVTPNATATYTTSVAPAGAESSVIIVTSGTTSYTITFGTGFLSAGTLATGAVTAKTFVINFVSDGTTMIETSRTAAL